MTIFQTWSGKNWDLMNPRAELVCADDIFQPAARMHRFTCHIKPEQYSVAEHSCHVHDLLVQWGEPPVVCLGGLLHDVAHESYLGDMSRPLQALLHAALGLQWKIVWGNIVRSHDRAVASWVVKSENDTYWNLRGAMRSYIVKRADDTLLATEKAQVIHKTPPWPDLPDDPWLEYDGRLVVLPCWGVQRAHAEIVRRFEKLRAEVCR